ncbi:MAG: LysR substrate-binding domain-containing protein [Opitutaceae bacterium]|nr:LysR substrate-binding domain-containing protein [Opitutaceae bacterium]
MELRHLRYFVAVAEEENVTRAAARLNVSQPPLSRQIRDLEEELGVALLERGANSLQLTEAGRVFLGEARAVLQRATEAVHAARAAAAGDIGELHIGYSPSPTANILPEVLRAFRKRAPRVRVNLHDLKPLTMLEGMRDGSLQAAMMVNPGRQLGPGLEFVPLISLPVMLVVSPHHALGDRKTVSLEEVLAEPIVAYSRRDYPDYHEALKTALGPARARRLNIVEECDGGMSLAAAVTAGRGLAFSASLAHLAGSRLRYLAIKPPLPATRVGVAFRSERLPPLAQQFVAVARELAVV